MLLLVRPERLLPAVSAPALFPVPLVPFTVPLAEPFRLCVFVPFAVPLEPFRLCVFAPFTVPLAEPFRLCVFVPFAVEGVPAGFALPEPAALCGFTAVPVLPVVLAAFVPFVVVVVPGVFVVLVLFDAKGVAFTGVLVVVVVVVDVVVETGRTEPLLVETVEFELDTTLLVVVVVVLRVVVVVVLVVVVVELVVVVDCVVDVPF